MFILDASVSSAGGAGNIDSYKSQIQIAESEKRELEAKQSENPGSDTKEVSTADGKTVKVQVARPRVDNSGEIAGEESKIALLQTQVQGLEEQKKQMRVQEIQATTTNPDDGR